MSRVEKVVIQGGEDPVHLEAIKAALEIYLQDGGNRRSRWKSQRMDHRTGQSHSEVAGRGSWRQRPAPPDRR